MFLPARLAAHTGIAFAETQGETIDAPGANGQGRSIADGAEVSIKAAREVEMGDSDEATVDVIAEGETLTLPAARVLREGNLTRAPDGSFAVFDVIESCGDLCHTAIYLVARDGRRVRLGGGVVDLVVAWRSDGKEVAIGSGSLWIVSLPALAVRQLPEYTAPAYSPDGTLYVRDQHGSAFTVGAKVELKWRAPPSPPPEEGDHGADDPPPVRFDAAGKPSFEPG
jgi:hypothetical protein